jgi:hypothetical protein
MATAVQAPIPLDHHLIMPSHPSMSTSKQNRILIWRREVASALVEDASSNAANSSNAASIPTSASTSAVTSTKPTGTSGLLPTSTAVNADSPTSSFSSASSRPRALWKRLSKRLALHHGSDSAAATATESPRTAMYRDVPPDAAALEGLTVVDSVPDRPEAEGEAQAQPSPSPEAQIQEEQQQPLGDGSSSDGADRGLRERQERLQRAARLLERASKKEERVPVVSVRS